jgi:hypothetical protein
LFHRTALPTSLFLLAACATTSSSGRGGGIPQPAEVAELIRIPLADAALALESSPRCGGGLFISPQQARSLVGLSTTGAITVDRIVEEDLGVYAATAQLVERDASRRLVLDVTLERRPDQPLRIARWNRLVVSNADDLPSAKTPPVSSELKAAQLCLLFGSRAPPSPEPVEQRDEVAAPAPPPLPPAKDEPVSKPVRASKAKPSKAKPARAPAKKRVGRVAKT